MANDRPKLPVGVAPQPTRDHDMIGSTLGPFQVVAKLGEGGMGEVYRALDTNLKRPVAIKLLPASVASDADRLARFQREAEVLALLNHPNIAQIHGLETSTGVTALVMELVEGPTLAERIAQGPIPVEEALPIARQIADALEAAHEQGIVHRDLKPANVKVRADGSVKVLDFGLAKAIEPASALRASAGQVGGLTPSMSPTITSPAMTQAGVILGTAAYMSPEQARGKPVDKRADVWAFGVVLFEMLTGRRAFPGEDITDTIVSVVSKEPDWKALPASTPPALRSLMGRCVVKDPRNRLRDMGDARIALADVRHEPAWPADRADGSRSSPRRERVLAAVALLFAFTTIFAFLRPLFAPAPPLPPTVRFEVLPPKGMTVASGPTLLSPDGRRLAFVAASPSSRAIAVRSLDSSTAQVLAGTETTAAAPLTFFWSDDSQQIAYFADGKLRKIPATGGPSQVICTLPAAHSYMGTWSKDGVILFGAGGENSNTLFRVQASGGQPVPITQPGAKPEYLDVPSFLPDGRHYLAWNGSEAAAYVGSLDSNERRPLPGVTSPATYSSGGYLIFGREGSVVAQHFDLGRLQLSGDVLQIAEAAQDLPSASTTGALAYRPGIVTDSQLVWLDRTGNRLSVESLTGSLQAPNLSRDGKRLAIERTDASGTDVWVIDLVRGTNTRLTDDPGDDSRPVFSQDGTRVAFTRGHGIFQKSSSGTGPEERLADGETTDWSPDGQFISFIKDGQLWALPLAGDRKPMALVETKGNDRRGRFSPDGRWIAYESDFSGRLEVYVQQFPPTAERVQVSANGGGSAYWRSDGKELFFRAPDGKIMVVDVTPGSTFQVSAPRVLFNVDGVINNGRFVVSPDGQRFLLPIRTQGQAEGITVILNWASGLKNPT